MSNVVFFTIFGRGIYGWYVQMAISTLRHPKLGNYTGKIVVFTDDPLLILPEDVEKRLFHLPEGDQFYWSLRARFDAGLLLDHSEYDQIMYCDSDFLFTQDINQLFVAPDKLQVHQEVTPLWRNQWAHAYLTAEEMSDAQISQRPTINAGMWVVPGQMARDFLGKWQAFIDADPFRECVSHNQAPDQSALNAILLREEFPYQVMPYEWVAQPHRARADYPDAKMLHFAGKRKDYEMERRYRALVAKIS